ncbi:hypothetical protein E0F64_09900, partial [Streptococcus pyogenes]
HWRQNTFSFFSLISPSPPFFFPFLSSPPFLFFSLFFFSSFFSFILFYFLFSSLSSPKFPSCFKVPPIACSLFCSLSPPFPFPSSSPSFSD